MRFILAAIVGTYGAALSGSIRAAEPEASKTALKSLQATKPFVLTDRYEHREIEGWSVRVNRELLGERADLGARALELLATKLRNVREVVPADALPALEKVPIWLGVDDYAEPNACYHPSADWLRNHGWNADKAGAVEIGNAAIFILWSRTQPMIVLHELAHAFHHQVLGHTNAGIRAAFQRARHSGIYDSVQHADGRMQRAYALNNDQEFFAEMSEAYFGRNDFFPFTREELKAHDPDTFNLIEELWNRASAWSVP